MNINTLTVTDSRHAASVTVACTGVPAACIPARAAIENRPYLTSIPTEATMPATGTNVWSQHNSLKPFDGIREADPT